MKFASDLHIGKGFRRSTKRRHNDLVRAKLRELREASYPGERLILGGDIVETPTNRNLDAARDILAETVHDLEVWLAPGNHDVGRLLTHWLGGVWKTSRHYHKYHDRLARHVNKDYLEPYPYPITISDGPDLIILLDTAGGISQRRVHLARGKIHPDDLERLKLILAVWSNFQVERVHIFGHHHVTRQHVGREFVNAGKLVSIVEEYLPNKDVTLYMGHNHKRGSYILNGWIEVEAAGFFIEDGWVDCRPRQP